jgi:glycosyltransferase involved in cell wall biosynthesis
MRILLINNNHFRKGGADSVYFNTADLLRKHGHEVVFFSLGDPKNSECAYSAYFPSRIDFRQLPFLGKIEAMRSFIVYSEAEKKLVSLIDDYKPDIAHIHLFLGGLSNSILKALKKRNIPSVHTVHDYRLICPAYTFLDKENRTCEACKDGKFLRCAVKRCALEPKFTNSLMLALDAYYRALIQNPIDLIDHFIFVSYFSKKKHSEYSNRFVTKSSILYNFMPGKMQRSPIRGEYMLYFGRLSREKGIEMLLDVAEKLRLKLVIAGTGPLEGRIVSRSSETIEFVGYKSGKELEEIIRNCSFVVVPSEWYENNPMAIIEAFSYGKPVIGSDIGGIPELLESGGGLLFQPKDPESLIDVILKATGIADDEYVSMSQAAFEFALSHFSEEQHYEHLMQIFKMVTS